MINISGFIDHTLLSPTATYNDFQNLCEQAISNGFWAVCVPPYMVKSCKEPLSKTDVKVCTVIGFPLGYNHYLTKEVEIKTAINCGADELDVVINISALKSKDFSYVQKELDVLRKISKDKILKVIVETSYLSIEEKNKIAKIVLNSGADFIKTSTGFSNAGANIEDIILFKSILKNSVRIKASGGIDTYEKAVDFIKAGASRLGTSKSLKIINNEKNNI